MSPSPSPVAVKLPLTYEPDKLLEALEQISAYRIRQEPTHADPPIHDHWGGASLHAIGGEWRDAGPGDPALSGFQPTELVRVAPYFQYVLDSLECPKHSVRVSVIWPQGAIRPHRDWFLGFDKGIIRLHIPITTSPEVEFVIDDQRCDWRPGELWYGDFSKVHHVHNRGSTRRVHILADVCVNDFVLGLFPPELVARQADILMYEEPVRLDDETMAALSCSFTVSGALAGVPLFKTLPVAWNLAPAFSCTVHPAGDQLVLGIEGQDLIGLEPIGDDRFRLVGAPPSMILELHRGGDTGDTIEGVELRFGEERLRFPVH